MFATIVEAFGALLLVVVAGMAFFVFRRSNRRPQAFISEPKTARTKMHPEVATGLWTLLGATLIICGLLYATFDRDFLIQVPTAKVWAPAAAIAGIFFMYRFAGAAGKYFGALVIGFLLLFFVIAGRNSVRTAKQIAEQVRSDSAAAAIARQYTLDSLRVIQQSLPIPETATAVAVPEPVTTPVYPTAEELARRAEEERVVRETAVQADKTDLANRVVAASLGSWRPSSDLRNDINNQRVVLVCTRKGFDTAAAVGKRLEALGAKVTYDIRDAISAPSGGQLQYSSANYRTSTAIQAALIDLIRLDLLNQPGLSQVVLLLNVEQ